MSMLASRCCGAVLVSLKVSTVNKEGLATPRQMWCCTRCNHAVMEDKRRFNYKAGFRLRGRKLKTRRITAQTSPIAVMGVGRPETGSRNFPPEMAKAAKSGV
jgi:hypothetical protein